jgi:hypothetical protein
MRARKLIEDATFGPDRLKEIGRAFDETWTEIAGSFGNDAQTIEGVRLRLATIVLALAKDGRLDRDQLKLLAMRALRQEYAISTQSP